MEEKRLHLTVSGRVQGVGFRYFTYITGTNLHLHGWVRNRSNGDVEILAEGPRNHLDSLIQEIKKGPDMAHVINLDLEWSNPQEDLPPFTIRSTR
jgi:acylphosphatase